MNIKKTIFISGINGQDGSYLAEYLVELGYDIHGSIRSHDSNLSNLAYLKLVEKISLHVVDLEDFNQLTTLLDEINPSLIFNLSSQSSVSFSFKEPWETLRPNINILLNLIEYLRNNPSIRMYQASSSEMYGNPSVLPITETHTLNPISPYGLSKSIGFQLVLMYRELYRLYIVNGIMFNHESFLRSDHFFIKKVIQQSLKIKYGFQDYLEVGNLEIKRDFGSSKEYVRIMYKSLKVDKPDDYIISSGKSTSLKDIVTYIFKKLEIPVDKIKVMESLFRPNEIIDIYGNNKKANEILNMEYILPIWDLLDSLIDEERQNLKTD